MQISTRRIWTPVLTSPKTDGISYLYGMISSHRERNHPATANSHLVQGVLGFLMSVTGTRRKIVWAGKLRCMRELNSIFKSLQRRDTIPSMTGVFRRCGCVQVRLKIQRMGLRWKSTAPIHCILLWRVWCMPSGLKTRRLTRMQHSGWSKLQSPRQQGGGQNRNSWIRNHMFRSRKGLHTLLISNGLRKSKLK